ncbi:MAG: sterol desaturase family protein [Planctomycetaceae bacterium]|nr:sterol desaturase family protein [Planctomycetaceae bacterium]
MGLAAVVGFLYPDLLTLQELRYGFYRENLFWIRPLLFCVLTVAYLLGITNLALRKNKTLGFTTIGLALTASLLGGASAESAQDIKGDVSLGLDFFFLNLIMLGALFIPLERIFKKVDQRVLRYEWREDLLYFFISKLFIQFLTLLSLAPALALLANTQWASGLREAIASQNIGLQILEIMFFTDLAQYWFHRCFHRFPLLWNFHAVHHSAQAMDWMAGSRMHIFEVILLRSFTTLPMYLIGYAEPALYGYILLVYLSSVFIHSNIGIRFHWLEYVIATPRFHHWHHGIEKEAINKNYAVHFPALDLIFGTYYFPKDEWPKGYGIEGNPVPRHYWNQFLYPFFKKRMENKTPTPNLAERLNDSPPSKDTPTPND